VKLGDADNVFPAAEADRVWLYTRSTGAPTLTEVDIQGRIRAVAHFGASAAVADGLVAPTGTAGLSILDPVTGAVVRQVTTDGFLVGATAAGLVAWAPSACSATCPRLFFTDRSRRTNSVQLPKSAHLTSAAAFSPDGRYIAVLSTFDPAGVDLSQGAQLLLVDVLYGTARMIPQSNTGYLTSLPNLAWSRNSRAVFLPGDGGKATDAQLRLLAWKTDAAGAVYLPRVFPFRIDALALL
jgi:dipeptidyl aminopeptidase/acylaminoacyl peptidase